MVETTSVPYYFDWGFWGFIAFIIAIILSQLPPITQWLRRGKLLLSLHERINITERIGNPNISLHIYLSNIGGRKLRIMSMELDIKREDGSNFILPGQTFTNPNGTLLSTQFQLKQGEDWFAFVKFFKPFSTNDERESKKFTKDIKNSINKQFEKLKHAQKEAEKKVGIEADKKLIDDAIKFFNDHNVWFPGEYTVEFKIKCKPEKASVKRHFKFTLYESDSAEIVERVERYKYGDGIYWDDENRIPVSANVKDMK